MTYKELEIVKSHLQSAIATNSDCDDLKQETEVGCGAVKTWRCRPEISVFSIQPFPVTNSTFVLFLH